MDNVIKNQRTIPTVEEFKTKHIIEEGRTAVMSDVLYMYLQSISKHNPNESHRYILKNELNIKSLTGKNGTLKMSRQTYYNKISDLKLAGLLVENENYYILNCPETYFLLPFETLVYLLDNGINEGVFKVLAWLGDRNKIMAGNVVFSQNIIIEKVLGLNNKSAVQHRQLKNNLDLLHRLGLIRCIKEKTAKGNEVYKMTNFSTTIGGLDNVNWNSKMFK